MAYLIASILMVMLVGALGCSWIILAYLIAEDENEKRNRRD